MEGDTEGTERERRGKACEEQALPDSAIARDAGFDGENLLTKGYCVNRRGMTGCPILAAFCVIGNYFAALS